MLNPYDESSGVLIAQQSVSLADQNTQSLLDECPGVGGWTRSGISLDFGWRVVED